MGIELNYQCVQCFFKKHVDTVEALDPSKANDFFKDLMVVLREAMDGGNSAVISSKVNGLYKKHFGISGDRFLEEKRISNAFIKERLPQISALLEEQQDPVFAALQFAILGNYLDFSALKGQVSFEKLDQMLSDALNMELEEATYESLCADLSQGKRLLYITDNAGEIGFDRLLAQQIHKKYPQLEITFCVRGKPTHNDATREDAAYMEIEFPIIDTGNDIGGVDIPQLSKEAKEAMDKADVIIAKGMGNTESMYGCGYNIYYAFLVKCVRFANFFQKPHMTPMLVRDKK